MIGPAYTMRQMQDGRTLLIDLQSGGITTIAEAISMLDGLIGYSAPMRPRPAITGSTPGLCPHCGGILRRLAVNTTPANRTGDASAAVLLCVRCHYEEWI